MNKAIYGQTQGNIDKTVGVLKRRGINTDLDKLRRQQELGLNPTSDGRMAELMKETVISPETALRELQDKQKRAEMMSQAANARNPFNDPNRSTAQVVE